MYAGTVLNKAGSLRYRWIKNPCFNANSLQCKRTLVALYQCIIYLLKIQYSVEKAA